MKNKSIAFFTTSLQKGGAERVVSILSNNLANKYDITIILLKNKIDFYVLPEIKIVVINFSWKNIFKSFAILNKKIKENRIEKLVTFLYQPSFIAIFAKIIFKWNLQVYVSERTYTLSHYQKNTFKGKTGLFFIRWLYNKADMIIPNSKLTAYSLKHDLNIHVPINVFYNPIEALNLKLKNHNLGTNKLRILNVANNYWYKNQIMLIKALSLLNEYNWELTIIGSGPLNFDLRKFVYEHNLSNAISFIENENAADFYYKFDLFISTSLIEGFPNSILEAMNNGLAIIATDCKSGPREILAPKSNIEDTLNGISTSEFSEFGILIPVGNYKILAQTIQSFLFDPFLLKKYKTLAKKRANDFIVEKIMNDFINIIDYEKK